MSEFEQMMADINVPEEIAHQITRAVSNADVMAMWEKLSAATGDCFQNAPIADCICALAMLNASIGEKLAMIVKFGKTPDDTGEPVHVNFCIMAISLIAIQTLALQTLKESHAANESGDADV